MRTITKVELEKPEEEKRKRRRGSRLHSLMKLVLFAGGVVAAKAVVRKMREYDLSGKVVFITGGSRGLGLVLAREFAKEGARLAICARDSDELDLARDELVMRGADVFTLVCDVTDRKAIEDAVLAVQMHFGTLDVLVNNAGVIQVGPMETMTHEDYELAMNLHFWAPLHASLAALPEMGRRRSGRIINIASFGGKVAVPHMLPYSASKFALVGLSEGMRAELLRYGIYVTTVCPSLIRTGSHKHAMFKGQHKKEYTIFSLTGATPGLSMSAEHVAKQIVAACKRGDPEVLPGAPVRLASALHGLFPGLTTDVWGTVNRALPGPGGIQTMQAAGKDSESNLSPSRATERIDRAAVRNNEMR
jgi:NAD(P)-dependent dehydrogenase (short-subunit alcohol dehydrogenase family)